MPAAGAIPGYAFGVEPNWLERTYHSIRVPAAQFQRVRILQLSDLHVSTCVPFSLIARAIALGLEAKPDLICLTGDLITNSHAFDAARSDRLLWALTQTAPTFASLGNHDGGSWAAQNIGGFADTAVVRSLLASAGVALLHNGSQKVDVHGQPIYLAGLGDLWSAEADPDTAFRSFLPEPGAPVVLLAHNPDTKDLVQDQPWHVMLSGIRTEARS